MTRNNKQLSFAEQERIERLAIILDYLNLNPKNIPIHMKGKGTGGLNDRHLIWNLLPGEAPSLALSEKRKQEFRNAAKYILDIVEKGEKEWR